MLSNLETEKSKLIQIALVGQPNLRVLMARPELEQLRQRVTVSYHLQALDAPETAAYINHRLRRAAIGAPLEFNRDVTDLIHGYSKGIPRKINVIADAVLLFAYGEEQHTISRTLTYEVLDELEGTGVLAPSPTRPDNRPAAPVANATASQTASAEPTPPLRLGQLAADDQLVAVRYSPQPATRTDFTAEGAVPPAATPAAPRSATNQAVASPPVRPTAIADLARPAPATAQLRPAVPPLVRSTSFAPPVRPPAVAMPARTIPAATAVRPAEPEGLWSRLRRGLSVLSKPAFED
jgi:hypothetical protein